MPRPADADGSAGDSPEAALEEALARARRHAGRALAEALEAGRALLEALSIATSGAPAAAHPLFEQADRWIRRASRGLAGDGSLPSDLGPALAQALEAEIARWEQRARSDDDARAVLRAFLGLREVLWELGVRPAGSGADPPDDRPDTQPAPRARRVERVPVQG